MMRLRLWLANQTGAKLIAINYGRRMYVRRIRWDGDGLPYVKLISDFYFFQNASLKWIPLNFRTDGGALGAPLPKRDT